MSSRKYALSFLVLTMLAVACARGGGGQGDDDDDDNDDGQTQTPAPTPGTFADFSNAVAIGLQEGSPASLSAQLGPGAACYETMPTGQLVAVDSAGNTTPLLNQAYDAAYFLVTSSNIIVRGGGLVEEAGTGVPFNCCILAIPRSLGVSPVACLSTSTPHFASGPRDLFDRTGIASSNDTIYFSQGDPTGAGNPTGDVLRWDGSSDFVETVLHLDGLAALYASDGAENICAVGCDPDCVTICGSPEAETYSVMDGFGDLGFFQIGSSVWDGQDTIDLTNLNRVTLSGRVNFAYQNDPYKYERSDGSHIGIAQMPNQTTVFVVKLMAPDLVQRITTPAAEGWNWQHMVGGESLAVVAGKLYGPPYTDNLRFVDLTTLVVGTANYMAPLNLLQVSGMSFANPTVLEVEGTGTNGLETSVFIDAVTGDVTQAPPSDQQFIQIRYLQ